MEDDDVPSEGRWLDYEIVNNNSFVEFAEKEEIDEPEGDNIMTEETKSEETKSDEIKETDSDSNVEEFKLEASVNEEEILAYQSKLDCLLKRNTREKVLQVSAIMGGGGDLYTRGNLAVEAELSDPNVASVQKFLQQVRSYNG